MKKTSMTALQCFQMLNTVIVGLKQNLVGKDKIREFLKIKRKFVKELPAEVIDNRIFPDDPAPRPITREESFQQVTILLEDIEASWLKSQVEATEWKAIGAEIAEEMFAVIDKIEDVKVKEIKETKKTEGEKQ